LPHPLEPCTFCGGKRDANVRVRVPKVGYFWGLREGSIERTRAETLRGRRVPACEACAAAIQGRHREGSRAGQVARAERERRALAEEIGEDAIVLLRVWGPPLPTQKPANARSRVGRKRARALR
jgi:hypothetical protein